MTIAIATNTLGAPSETFVRQHVERLNGGDTVVVCRRAEAAWTTNRPTLLTRQTVGWGTELPRALLNQLHWGGLAIPGTQTDQAIADFLRRHGVGTVLAEFGPVGCALRRAAWQVGLPLYVYFRGRDASSLLRRRGVRRAYRQLFPEVAGVIAVAQFLVDQLAACGFRHNNTHVIPSGVDTKLFIPADKTTKALLFVGRFVPKKAPDLVIRAFARNAERHPQAHLTMIGSGPMLADCQQLAGALGLSERITFLGSQSHAIVRQAMNQAAIFLQHSVTDACGDSEGLPSTIQEAMAAEALVVATRHAGIPEAVRSGENGLLVDEGDLDGMAEALAAALERPDWRRSLARQARQDALEHFDSDLLRHRLEAVLQGRTGR